MAMPAVVFSRISPLSWLTRRMFPPCPTREGASWALLSMSPPLSGEIWFGDAHAAGDEGGLGGVVHHVLVAAHVHRRRGRRDLVLSREADRPVGAGRSLQDRDAARQLEPQEQSVGPGDRPFVGRRTPEEPVGHQLESIEDDVSARMRASWR